MPTAGLRTVIATAIGAALALAGSARPEAVDGIRSPRAIVQGADGALWFSQPGNSVGRITTAGTVRIFRRRIGCVVEQVSTTTGRAGTPARSGV